MSFIRINLLDGRLIHHSCYRCPLIEVPPHPNYDCHNADKENTGYIVVKFSVHHSRTTLTVLLPLSFPVVNFTYTL